MLTPDKFLTESISKSPIGQQVCRILSAAINAVDPFSAVSNVLSRSDSTLLVNKQPFSLEAYHHIYTIGVGKACVPMAEAVHGILGKYITQGIIITKDGYGRTSPKRDLPPNFQIFEAGHPLPDYRSYAGTIKFLELIRTLQVDDLIIFLISGGGSSLLTQPAPGITLADIQEATSFLLTSGATIHEINTLRKHIDLVKGGQLARMIYPTTIISLVLSDVIGDQLETIASGPTVPDSTTYQDAINVLQEKKLTNKIPTTIIAHLNDGAKGLYPETPKPGDFIFQNVNNYLIGSNVQATQAAFTQARQEGFFSMVLTNYIQGEAKHVGQVIGAIALQAAMQNTASFPRPACIILGGETTVTITGNGKGGRNQEIALSIVDMIAGLDRVMIVAFATDGGDGPTDAAGAVVTGDTHARAKAMGMKSSDFLTNNDSYTFFEPLSDLIITGPTQTNVNDLCMIFTY